jgi:penicillin-binding protein-related factor A (putative recombinase)
MNTEKQAAITDIYLELSSRSEPKQQQIQHLAHYHAHGSVGVFLLTHFQTYTALASLVQQNNKQGILIPRSIRHALLLDHKAIGTSLER